jgi:hypothetical protein
VDDRLGDGVAAPARRSTSTGTVTVRPAGAELAVFSGGRSRTTDSGSTCGPVPDGWAEANVQVAESRVVRVNGAPRWARTASWYVPEAAGTVKSPAPAEPVVPMTVPLRDSVVCPLSTLPVPSSHTFAMPVPVRGADQNAPAADRCSATAYPLRAGSARPPAVRPPRAAVPV